ncbi:uncharacterized protein MONBRDRAFT_26023 [Monosiga brevicollis MX1]|uniref:Uncharacterized protein n=1 Tax=Monosiga brevicollis TaxID=81824 RepID=A9V153_MONBE|nr:uncharacterized protein MONBRDRAFT_26023 [Monosiga brevicollis MX1]EDQ88747.1 predicted protein [Monosiga brevicollis MX1]|eukprot:XP_001746360.1 hypothetical protein [Monosiga brevicollis MX1]
MRQTSLLGLVALLLCGLATGLHSAEDTSTDAAATADRARAMQMLPAKRFSASHPAALPEVLNSHLRRHAARYGHAVRACEAWSTSDLNAVLAELVQQGLADDGARSLLALYAQRGEPRRLRLSSLAAYSAAWQQEEELIDRLGAASREAQLLRAGKCYEASMLYIHGASSKVKQGLSTAFNVPLLPEGPLATLVTDHISAMRLTPTADPATSSPIDSNVLNTVQDQVVCVRCHVTPNATFSPRQYDVVVNGSHPLLRSPQVLRSAQGVLNATLDVGVARLSGGPLEFNVRAYNGGTPGPTLWVQPGDSIHVTLNNHLEAPDACQAGPSGAGPDSNFYRCPNTTNIHLHGLWVTPHDVFRGIGPGGRLTQTYSLTTDHAPGTNWYHPHFHGSVSLQLAMGMAGAVVVDDPPNSLPPALEALRSRDHVMLLQSIEYFNYTQDDINCPYEDGLSHCHNMDGAGSLATLRAFSSDALPLNMERRDPGYGYPIDGVYFLLNGQFQPVVTMQPGEYQRWRLVNGAHQASLSLSVPGCTVWLLSMDGVYLSSPRLKNTSYPLVLAPGARGDVAVSCAMPGLFELRSNENPDVWNLGAQEGFNTGVIALVNVSGPNLNMSAPTRLPSRPAYLQDLRPASVPAGNTRNVSWDLIRLINNTAGLTDVPIYGVSQQAFNASNPSRDCINARSGVQEWQLVNPIWICNASVTTCLSTMDRNAASGALLRDYQEPVTLSHGFHLHTFKFQVASDSNGGVSADYELGDWRDTVTTPLAGWVRIRWQPQTFEGVIPWHCHMSVHSDRGMIGASTVASQCPAAPNAVSRARAAAQARARPAMAHLASGNWEPRLGNFTWNVSTHSPAAQALFNEATMMAFGFARDAASATYLRALQADPTCAMCAWGVAYANGPFLNHPECSNATCGLGFEYAELAATLAANHSVTAAEAMLIRGMQQRYSQDPKANQTAHFMAYAQALNATALVHSDPTLAAFAAEAYMLLHCQDDGYHFNFPNGTPVPDLAWVIDLLGSYLFYPNTNDVLPGPRHPFVSHLYIHAVEPSGAGMGPNAAGRAFGVAQRLSSVLPNVTSLWQHLQHMPAHIFLRTGYYGLGVAANMIAHASDATWLNHSLVPYGPGHNLIFLIYCACMDGQSSTAIHYGEVVRQVYQAAPDRPDGPGADLAYNWPATTFVRFGSWDAILAADWFTMPRPFPYQQALAHYAIGLAQAHTGNVTGARASLQNLQRVQATLTGRAATYCRVANWTLGAAVARATGPAGVPTALSLLSTAVAEQMGWPYDEPPDFHQPIQQCLGQLQLELGNYSAAYDTFQANLAHYPNNGWALWGLLQAVQHLPYDPSRPSAASITTRLSAAWERADVPLTSACALIHFP